MALWTDKPPDDDDDKDNKFDESRAGPEYWMHKRERAKRKLSRCLKCQMPQLLIVDALGAFAVCQNKHCNYAEAIINWKI